MTLHKYACKKCGFTDTLETGSFTEPPKSWGYPHEDPKSWLNSNPQWCKIELVQLQKDKPKENVA